MGDLTGLLPLLLEEFADGPGSSLTVEIVWDEVRTMAEEVAALLDALEARLRREEEEALASLADILVHALHNRFGAADTASRLLASRSVSVDPARLERIAGLVRSGIDDGLRTVEGVRTLLTRPGPRGEAQPFPIPLPLLIRDVLRDQEAGASALGIELRISEPLPEVVADGRRLRPVLSNLVRNALAHHDPEKASRWIRISAAEPGHRRLLVCVEDNGVGIGEERREEIFLPGVRGGDARGAHGAGLGLAAAREAAWRMDGTIEASGEPGVGALFRVTCSSLLAGGPGGGPLG